MTPGCELLERCLRGEGWSRALLEAAIESGEILSVVAEGLSDRFEPTLAELYGELFAEAVALVSPRYCAREVRERYREVRRVRPYRGRPKRVVVLSRVTLGADVAITSVLLDAAKKAFPDSEVLLAGPRKNWELFAGDPRVGHLEVRYDRRGAFLKCLEITEALAAEVALPGTLVLDPDSRLSQLGLLPMGDEYRLFDSRSYGSDTPDSLTTLAVRWVEEALGIRGAKAFCGAEHSSAPQGITVSLGVGENQAKRVGGSFEADLLRVLSGTGLSVLVDTGGGGEETARVERAAQDLAVQLWRGSFAGFAAAIQCSRLYVGYDSSGQHVAAAHGVPLVTIFAGAVCPRFAQRWAPTGPGPKRVLPAGNAAPGEVLAGAREAIIELL